MLKFIGNSFSMLLMLLLAILIIFWVYFTAILWPLAMFHHFWTAFYDPLKYECFIGTITLFSALYTPFVHWKKRRSYDERTYGIFFLLPRDLEISVLFFLLSSSGCAPCMHAALVRTAVRSFAARHSPSRLTPFCMLYGHHGIMALPTVDLARHFYMYR